MTDAVANAIVVVLKGIAMLVGAVVAIVVLAVLVMAAGYLLHLGWNLL